jgi:phospholipid/cholesterol/gamma-HCH transport system substrate-binding protein
MSPRTPVLVGLVLIMAVAGMSYFVMNTTKDVFDDDATYPLVADFVDASGIRGKTRVQINGIDVGKIASIAHVRGKNGRLMARVTLRIANKYEVYQDAELRKAAESLLGDFRLDLDPGTPQAQKLASGEAIAQVHSLSDIDEIKGQLLQVSKNVNHVTESFSKVLSGPEGEGSLKTILHKVENSMAAIEQTTQALRHTIVGNDKVFSSIIKNVGEVSDALAQVARPGGEFRSVAQHLASLSGKLDHIADSLGGMVGGSSGAVQSGSNSGSGGDTGSVKGSLDNLNESLAHVNSVVRKVDDGQGTLGRVINDPGIADRVEETLDSANELIGSIASIETQIELRSEYDVPLYGTNLQIQPAIKNTLGLRIRPKPDKFYIIEAVSDPRGRQTRSLTTAQLNNSTTITTEETRINYNELKFSAQFAKRYYFATLRFGITENTGGLGLDLHGFADQAEVRLDAYDFDRRDPRNIRPIFPRLKVTGILELAHHIHAQLGIDDPFNHSLQTWFLGGVLRFTDEDLKAMLTIAPKP